MKEITLPVHVLREALPGLNKVVLKKSPLPVLQTVRLARDADGQVRIQATDLDAFATYTAKDPINGPIVDLLVPLEVLAKTIKILGSDDSLSFVLESKNHLKLRYSLGGSLMEKSVSTFPVEEFAQQPTITESPVQLENGFGMAFRQALECCSEDSSRRILNSACLDVSDKKFHYVVGTNGCCLYSANSFCFDLKRPVVIPDSRFLAWTDFLDDEPVSLTIQPAPTIVNGKRLSTPPGPDWIKLESGRWSFITKEIEGNYPNWKQVVPKDTSKWTSVEFSEEAIKQLVLVVPNLPGNDEKDHVVKISITAERVLFEGKNADDGLWTSIPVQNAKVSGGPVSVSLNRNYLLNGLRYGLNQLQVEDELTPVILSNAGKRLIIMPVRPEGKIPVQKATPPATPAASTSTATPTPPPETEATERTDVKTTTANSETSTVQPRHTTINQPTVKPLVEHIEQIKDNLKAAIRDLNDVADALKLAEKEKRATEKEIESVRNKLLQIQKVTI